MTECKTAESCAACRVMIVEDEAVIAMALRQQMQSLGCEVCCVVHSAEQALECVEQARVDAAFVDVALGGGMDGIELAGRLVDGFGVPVVVVSAYTDARTEASAREAGVVAMLAKPADDDELRDALHRALGSRG